MSRNGALMLAAAAMLLGVSTSRAEFRAQGQTLPTGGLSGGAYTMSLEMTGQNDAEDVEVWGRRWGWGGYRGYGWGGYRGYGWGGGWGGYRSYYGWGGGWGGYRSYYGWGGYRPYWGGYYSPYYYGYNFYRPYYYYPSYYYSPFCYISMTADNGTAQAPANGNFASEPNRSPYEAYPYDGGPRQPVPLPQAEPRQAPPPANAPLSVSLPSKTRFAYPAYGERTEPTSFAQDRRR